MKKILALLPLLILLYASITSATMIYNNDYDDNLWHYYLTGAPLPANYGYYYPTESYYYPSGYYYPAQTGPYDGYYASPGSYYTYGTYDYDDCEVYVSGQGNLNDKDCDGVPNNYDNCDEIPNPDQLDTNNNGIGDVCDIRVEISFNAQTIPAGSYLYVYPVIFNQANNRISNTRVTVSIPILNLQKTDIRSTSYYDSVIPLESQYIFIPSNVMPGTYEVLIIVKYNYNSIISQTIPITITNPDYVPSTIINSQPAVPSTQEVTAGISEQTSYETIETLEQEIEVIGEELEEQHEEMLDEIEDIVAEQLEDILPASLEETSVIGIATAQDINIGGKGAVYPIKILNQNKAPKSYMLSVESVSEWGTYRIEPSSNILLNCGKQETIYLYVTAENPEMGGKQDFTVNIASGDETLSVHLTANLIRPVQQQVVLEGAVFTIIIIILLVILILIAVFFGLRKLRDKFYRKKNNDEENFYERSDFGDDDLQGLEDEITYY